MSSLPQCDICGIVGPRKCVNGWLLCEHCQRLEYDRLAYQQGNMGGPEDGRSKLEMRVRAE